MELSTGCSTDSTDATTSASTGFSLFVSSGFNSSDESVSLSSTISFSEALISDSETVLSFFFELAGKRNFKLTNKANNGVINMISSAA